MMRNFAWVLIGLMLLAAVFCFRWALADVWATQVSQQLREPKLSDGEWDITALLLQRALQLAPDQASNLELAGEFYQAQAYREALSQSHAHRQDSLQKALSYYRQAICLNPAWPYLWHRLALTKMGLLQFDGELSGALDRVARLGPWEKSLQYDIAVIGLTAFEHLDSRGHSALYQAMEQSLKMQGKDGQQSLMSQFKLKKLCAGLDISSTSFPSLSLRCAEGTY